MTDDLTTKRALQMLMDKTKDSPSAHVPLAIGQFFKELCGDPNSDFVTVANCFLATAIAALMSIDPERTYHLTQNTLEISGRAEALKRRGADAAQIVECLSGPLTEENRVLCQQLRTILHGNDS